MQINLQNLIEIKKLQLNAQFNFCFIAQFIIIDKLQNQSLWFFNIILI